MMPSSQEKRERFEEEVLRHLSVLYRFTFYLSGNAADAEDLTQDTLHLAFRGFDGFRQGTDARAQPPPRPHGPKGAGAGAG